MNRSIRRLLVVVLTSSGLWYSCTSAEDTTSDTESPETSGAIDITNAIFTELSGDCASYAETYSSAVLDIQENVNFEGAVTIATTDTQCNLTVNSIPNHNFNDESASFASSVSEVNRSFTVSRSPVMNTESTALSQRYYDAIMLNGIVVDILSAGCYKPNENGADADGNVSIGCTINDGWLLDPLGVESKFGADSHNAHTQPDGTYHYHGNPVAMFDDNPGINGSPVIGFASDGFPIYGSYFLDPETNTVRKAISSYELKSGDRPGPDDNDPGGSYNGTYIDDYEFNGTGDLDACNGMTLNGQYGYYVTDTYPWMLACHVGTPNETFSKGQPKAKMDHSH